MVLSQFCQKKIPWWNYIAWGDVPDATEYRVYRGTSKGVTSGSDEKLDPTSTNEYGHTRSIARLDVLLPRGLGYSRGWVRFVEGDVWDYS